MKALGTSLSISNGQEGKFFSFIFRQENNPHGGKTFNYIKKKVVLNDVEVLYFHKRGGHKILTAIQKPI